MKNHLIKNIHIKDFKCFDDFKAKGFARVNLIGGKNNVGKTVFLEAVYLNAFSENINSFSQGLYGIKAIRELMNSIRYSSYKMEKIQNYIEQSNNIYVQTNMNLISYKIEDSNGIKKYFFKIGSDKPIGINVKDFSMDTDVTSNCDFIFGSGFSNASIRRSYSYVQKKDKEGYINNILNEFDADIEAFKIINEVPQCKSKGIYRPVTEFGDGTGHLITILAAFFHRENGYLFIDELDNGIHYTMLDSIWDIILKLSKEFNVQVFATTHSKECIESFNRVQLKLKNEESSYFELAKEKETNKIFMSALPPSQLEYELSHEGKFRGE